MFVIGLDGLELAAAEELWGWGDMLIFLLNVGLFMDGIFSVMNVDAQTYIL